MAYRYGSMKKGGDEMIHRHLGQLLKGAVDEGWTPDVLTEEIFSLIDKLSRFKTTSDVYDTDVRESIWEVAERALDWPRYTLPVWNVLRAENLTWED